MQLPVPNHPKPGGITVRRSQESPASVAQEYGQWSQEAVLLAFYRSFQRLFVAGNPVLRNDNSIHFTSSYILLRVLRRMLVEDPFCVRSLEAPPPEHGRWRRQQQQPSWETVRTDQAPKSGQEDGH